MSASPPTEAEYPFTISVDLPRHILDKLPNSQVYLSLPQDAPGQLRIVIVDSQDRFAPVPSNPAKAPALIWIPPSV